MASPPARGTTGLRLIAAPFTAFRPDGRLAPDVINEQAEALTTGGVQGAFVCGTTGEASTLSAV